MDEVVISLRPDMVLIFFGANDAVVAGGSTYVSLSEFEENIEKMITLIGKVKSSSSVETFSIFRFRTLHYHILLITMICIYTDATSYRSSAHHSTTYWRGGVTEV